MENKATLSDPIDSMFQSDGDGNVSVSHPPLPTPPAPKFNPTPTPTPPQDERSAAPEPEAVPKPVKFAEEDDHVAPIAGPKATSFSEQVHRTEQRRTDSDRRKFMEDRMKSIKMKRSQLDQLKTKGGRGINLGGLSTVPIKEDAEDADDQLEEEEEEDPHMQYTPRLEAVVKRAEAELEEECAEARDLWDVGGPSAAEPVGEDKPQPYLAAGADDDDDDDSHDDEAQVDPKEKSAEELAQDAAWEADDAAEAAANQ